MTACSCCGGTSEIRRVRLRKAASMFDVGYDMLLDAVQRGSLPAIKPQTAFLVKPEDVEALLVQMDEQRDRRPRYLR